MEFIIDAFVEIESEDDCCCCSFGSVRGLEDAPVVDVVVEEGSGEGVGLGLGGGGAELFVATIIGLFTLSSLLNFSSLFCVWLISWSDLDKMSLKNVSFSFRIADGAGSLYSSNEFNSYSLYIYINQDKSKKYTVYYSILLKKIIEMLNSLHLLTSNNLSHLLIIYIN